MSWFAQYFLHPGFLLPWGGALVLSPIIIHLINRLRYRRVRFAAMEFLLQSEQRNRKRVLLEQLLLLLLRVLIVVGLLMLIARLVLDPSQLSIFRGATVHHVVLLDDSGSMRNRLGDGTAFDEAVSVLRRLTTEGERLAEIQQFTLLTASDPHRPLFVQRELNEALLRDLDVALENLRCRHGTFDLAAGVTAAHDLLIEDPTAVKQLHVISDFRAGDWLEQPAVAEAVRAADNAEIAVNLVKTVGLRTPNLAVTDLSGDLQVAAVGVPLRLRVAVTNFGEEVASDVRLSIALDGQALPRQLVFDTIESHATVTREFDVAVETPQLHTVEVSLPADALTADNFRYLAVDVPVRNDVLVVDGDAGGDDGFYVTTALAADPQTTGFSPVLQSLDFLRREPLDAFRCIYLLNVAELTPDALDAVEQFVAAGGGLAWFVGDAVRPAYYHEQLYRGGRGLFPVPLGSSRRELVRGDVASPGPDLQFTPHPAFARIFADQDNPFIDSVSVDTYLPVADDWQRNDNIRKDGVATIAALRNGQPLMFEHRYGKGRVITCLTTAGPEWNNWAANPSYVLLHLEMTKYLVSREKLLPQRSVGEPIAVTFPAADYADRVEFSAPAATGVQTRRVQATAVDQPQETEAAATQLSARFTETDEPGVYRVRLNDQEQRSSEQWYSYNVPIEESRLALASTAELRKRFGADVGVQIQEPGSFDWLRGHEAGHEIRRLLILALVGLLLLEQILAYRFTYHPQTVAAAA